MTGSLRRHAEASRPPSRRKPSRTACPSLGRPGEKNIERRVVRHRGARVRRGPAVGQSSAPDVIVKPDADLVCDARFSLLLQSPLRRGTGSCERVCLEARRARNRGAPLTDGPCVPRARCRASGLLCLIDLATRGTRGLGREYRCPQGARSRLAAAGVSTFSYTTTAGEEDNPERPPSHVECERGVLASSATRPTYVVLRALSARAANRPPPGDPPAGSLRAALAQACSSGDRPPSRISADPCASGVSASRRARASDAGAASAWLDQRVVERMSLAVQPWRP